MEKEYKRFDIVKVDFGNNTIGSEQGGIRPALIIQNDTGNSFSTTTIVMPFTTKIKNLSQPTHTLVKCNGENGLIKNSMLLGECIRQISEERIVEYIGHVNDDGTRQEVKKVYMANFGLD